MRGEGKEFTSVLIGIEGADPADITEVTPREVILGESLLTGLQTSVKVHSFLHNTYLQSGLIDLKEKV